MQSSSALHYYLSWSFISYVITGVILGSLILEPQIAVLAFLQILVTFLGCISVCILAGRKVVWLVLAGIVMISLAFSPTMGIAACWMGGLLGYNLMLSSHVACQIMIWYHPLRSLRVLMDNAIAGLSLGWIVGWLLIST